MKIVHIVPGSGGSFYCENCVRDSSLVKALRNRGLDVMMVPLYLPMFSDVPEIAGDVPVFFGGINVYLQEKMALFRHTPRWIDRVFDADWILRLAAKRAGSTRATGLEEMTLSMIRGEAGNQAKELDRLLEWLREREQPDVIHLSNALLIGLARRFRQELGTRIVCSLQDEDTWIDAMQEPFRSRCWSEMAERGRDIDAFVTVSHDYCRKMRDRMNISADKIRVIYPGTEREGHRQAPLDPKPPVIGYLSRLCEVQGFDRLVEAYLLLRQESRFGDLRLYATGGYTADDRPLLERMRRKIGAAGAEKDFRIVEDFSRSARLVFLQELSLMSVPAPQGEAYGLFTAEAMASGVPLVLPPVGAFPELIEAAQCGMIYEANDVASLTHALAAVLDDPEKRMVLGQNGRRFFEQNLTMDHTADRTNMLYEELLS